MILFQEAKDCVGDGEQYERAGGEACKVLEDRWEGMWGLGCVCLGNRVVNLGFQMSVLWWKLR